jgi:hypothetical protein
MFICGIRPRPMAWVELLTVGLSREVTRGDIHKFGCVFAAMRVACQRSSRGVCCAASGPWPGWSCRLWQWL